MAEDLTFHQTIDAGCSACPTAFPLARVLLLDLQANAALASSLDEGSVHSGRCTRCGRLGRFDGALLLLHKHARPHLIFACVSASNRGNDSDVKTLVRAFHRSHPKAFEEGWERWSEAPAMYIEHRFLPYLRTPWIRPSTGEWLSPLQLKLLVLLQIDLANPSAVNQVVNLHRELLSTAAGTALRRLESLADFRGDGSTAKLARHAAQIVELIRLANR